MAGLGSLYELVKAGGLAVAQAAAAAGRSVSQITQQLGSSFLSASARAIGALAAPAFQQAQEQAFQTSRTTVHATGFIEPTGTAPIQYGPHQYAWTASFRDARTGQQTSIKGYYSSESQLTAAQLRAGIIPELEMLVKSPDVAGGNAALPNPDEVDLELRGYYEGV